MKKILVVIGTRPEAIKMAPVIKQLEDRPDEFDLHICTTGQHRSMLDQVLDFFNISPHTDFGLMEPGQSLTDLSTNILREVSKLVETIKPHFLIVHGDTSTAMLSALAGFYGQVAIIHIEAGLRTNNIYSPFPEEANRQIISRLATIHFAPTTRARQVLLNEGVEDKQIAVTGNTVIDALYMGWELIKTSPSKNLEAFTRKINSGKLILVTTHRRENHGNGILEICMALKEIAANNPKVQIVFPVHLNPKITAPVSKMLKGIGNIMLLEPLDYECFLWLMNRSEFILTDSGGLQEEAPSLNKPVLVMRDCTERPEAVESGAVLLVGTDKHKIVREVQRLLDDLPHYKKMALAGNPFGNGTAAKQIIEFINGYHG